MRLNVYFVVIDGIMWFAMDKPSNEGLLLQCIGELNSTWTYYYLFRNVVCLCSQGQRNITAICCLKLDDVTVIWEGLIVALTARYHKSPLNPEGLGLGRASVSRQSCLGSLR